MLVCIYVCVCNNHACMGTLVTLHMLYVCIGNLYIIYYCKLKICYKLLYVIQGVENSFSTVLSWPHQLMSEFLVAHASIFSQV